MILHAASATRSTYVLVLIGSLALLSSSCGGQPVPRTAPDAARPHFTWEIRTGGEFGGERSVCGSDQPKKPCELETSSGSTPTGVGLRLHLHSAGQKTNYLGVWKAPFLQGWKLSDYRELSGTVEPGDRPFDIGVSGVVTSQPGKYTFSVRLEAAQEGVAGGRSLGLDVPVVVTSADRR
jgi:hypothetical protein